MGLNSGIEIPIEAGGRLTGRVGRFSLGLLNIQTESEPTSLTRTTNFSAVRVKRDILRRSTVGVIATRRSHTESGAFGANVVYRLDVFDV